MGCEGTGMSERIWELFYQARHPHPKHGGQDMFFVEEFAELIIRECEKVISATISESIDHERKLDETGSWIVSDIRKHFGIEE
jgi:hypothetical protein